MKAFEVFYFERFEFDEKNLQASFYYSFDHEEFFEEQISFASSDFEMRKDFDIWILHWLLFHLHLALGMSYYKFFPTKKLQVQTWFLDEFQKTFWKKFYINGLGEFFYRNNFDPTNILDFESTQEKVYPKKDFFVNETYLVPIWWGKDSIVSLELLKQMQAKCDLVTFWVDDNILYKNTQEISGNKRLFLKRFFQNYSHLRDGGYYNWHVAITWMIAFVLEVAAYLYGYKYIVLSNERSANFWNVVWKDIQVNHQYSKSFEFEKDFWEYVEKYISSEVKYFSLLRPFYELKIAELFSKYGKKYFMKFSSCNTNFKIFKENYNKKHTWYWCLNCPKCAFVYAILRPFLSKQETLEIFWKELYNDQNQTQLFQELLWISGVKPFECVGTNEEVILAMKMAHEKWDWEMPDILQMFVEHVDLHMTSQDYERLREKIFSFHFDENMIPNTIKSQISSIL